MKNRVLRFFRRPEGVYHGSVFIQLSGGVGPSCLALDAQGALYIGQFETRGKLPSLVGVGKGGAFWWRSD